MNVRFLVRFVKSPSQALEMNQEVYRDKRHIMHMWFCVAFAYIFFS